MRRVLALSASALFGLSLAGCGGGGSEPQAIEPETSIAIGTDAGGIAATAKALWVSTPKGLLRIDPTTNTVVATVNTSSSKYISDPAYSIAADKTTVWVPEFQFSVLRRVDGDSNEVVAQTKVGASPEGVVVDGGSVWTANHHGGSVTRVSAKTDQVEATVRTGYRANSGPQGIASGLGSIWVGVSNVNSVFRIDPATNERQAKIPLSTEALACGDFALTDDAVWITSCGELPSATALDPTTNEVIRTVELGGYGAGATVVGARAWTALTPLDPDAPDAIPELVRLDAGSAEPAERLALPDGVDPRGVIDAFGALWIVDGAGGKLLRFSEDVLD